ncbi:RHS repeat-associated core domain-containing protein [Amycolatopsis suaedae]|uniref:Type IV secretion protein Rhs n=1 Tax=Amycolatopsis suaedae TaxID=2510978 RepID=A0A4Q7J772_9PSEU|nr:RHS repeat-associated core domain-containing protein [Amycolatopsis suaedae]RZQ63510.1 type IV secretion protein Rhs [Amycolatopsis suaedae]
MFALSASMLVSLVTVGTEAVAQVKGDPPPVQADKSVPGGPVPVPDAPVSETDKRGTVSPPEARWPAAGSAEVDVVPPEPARAVHTAGAAEFRRAGDLPVSIGRTTADAVKVSAAPGPQGRVRVETYGQDLSERLGIAGTLFQLSEPGTRAAAAQAPLAVRVDYGGYAQAYGGDFASRLGLVRYPACAVATPDKAECRTGTPVETDNNLAAKHVSASASLAEGPAVFAVAAAPAGSGGTFKATSLAPSGKWSAGGSSGDFTYSYPFAVPPVPGEKAPSISLGYSSGAMDGRTSSTNNQASIVGDGWEFSVGGYIERQYKPCTEDLGGNQGNTETGDRCWATDNATMVLAGVSTELVRVAGSDAWRPKNDDGSRIEKLYGAVNGDDNGEHWRVTTPDGTQHVLGVNRLPGWADKKPLTESTWTAPVFGNHAGEPCNKPAYADSWCQQAWRWNLDYTVDPRGNVITYYYNKEINHYGRNKTASAATPYVRAGQVRRIEYGLRSDNYFAHAPARIAFTTAERCLPSGTITCAPEQLNKDTAKSWPDVPFDQICDAGKTCEYRTSPSFFSRKRLVTVTTQVADGSGWRSVDTWSLSQHFPPAEQGDGLSPAMWLGSITRAGHVGGYEAMPPIRFGGVPMPNRVDAVDNLPPLTRFRLNVIHTESGGYTEVKYSDKDCRRADRMPANPEHNTMRCYPTWWVPENGQKPIFDWFHKYVVTAVTDDSRTGGASLLKTAYEYPENKGAWHFDENELGKPEHRTWSAWRGYAKVRTITGEPGTTQSISESLYMRGMDGDKLPNGGTRDVWVTDAEGGKLEDHPRLAGFTRETLQYAGDKVLSASITDPWLHGPTATNGEDKAFRLDTGAARGRTLLENGSWRRTQVTHSYNGDGVVEQVDDAGDTAVTGDEKCSRTSYARNPGAWMLTYVSRVREVALPCSAGQGADVDVLSDVRTYYDGKAHGEGPTRGDATATDRWDGARYQLVGNTVYDEYGRVKERSDPAGRKSTVAYTPATGLPTTVTNTNALGHVTVTEFDPARNSILAEVGANQERSDAVYDPLGRLVKAWTPNWTKQANPAKPVKEYAYKYRTDAPTVVTSKSLRDDGLNYTTSVTLYDGMLRERQTQTPGVKSGRVLTDTWYDSRGQAYKTNAAYYNDQPVSEALHGVTDWAVPNQTVTEFDALSRPTATILRSLNIEKWRTTTAYGGDRIHITPPQGETPSTVISNAQGKAVERRQYHGSTATGPYDVTTNVYNRKGQLESFTGPTGATWRYTYDALGRKVSDHDPDKGVTTYAYDQFDRLVSTTDARGRVVSTSYDELDRKTATFDGPVGGPKLAEWTYDTLHDGKTKRYGQQTSSTRYAGGRAYTRSVLEFDVMNRVKSSKVTIPAEEGGLAGEYVFGTNYKAVSDLVSSTTQPAAGGLPAENIFHSYNDLGLPTETVGLQEYAREHMYSFAGETLRLTVGNKTNVAWIGHNYDEATRRVTETQVSRNSSVSSRVFNRAFSYDPAGNITRVADTPHTGPVDTQCFRYDYLRRMTSAFTPAGGDCSVQPTTANIGGSAPYWHDYTYDKAGNRLSKTDHTAQGDTTYNYEYPKGDQPQPHALRAITRSGPTGTARDEYTYDPAGNTATRMIAGDTQKLDWDSEGHLAKITHPNGAETTHVYDADGQRLLKREPGLAVLYLPGMELTLDTAKREVTGKRYYTHGGSAVAMRSSVGGVTLLFGDHQGTTVATIADKPDLPITRRFHDPFGLPRGPQPQSWPDDKGFVGGVKDSSGLTHVGAREYEAETGRFISVDPVMDTVEPQRAHGYAYANNSPVTFSDPTGLAFSNSCGPDGILCGTGLAMQSSTYTETRVYWMKKKKYSRAVIGRFLKAERERKLWRARQAAARQQGLANAGISEQEYEELRKVAASKDGWFDKVVEQLPDILGDVTGVNDIKDCVSGGDMWACAGAIIGLIPLGKLGKALGAVGRIFDAIVEGFKWADKVAAARRRLSGVQDAVAAAENAMGSACSVNSFAAGTLVLMADGSRKPIETILLGESVWADDPTVGVAGPRKVVGTIVSEGMKDLVEISMFPPSPLLSQAGTVTATEGHPFWLPETRKWARASELTSGTMLRTAAGSWVSIDTVNRSRSSRTVYNLTIAGLRTYHVAVPEGDLLVHNAGWKCGDDVFSPTASGKEPAWSTVRARFWKNEAAEPAVADQYGEANVARMQRGRAPQRNNPVTGKVESMELSHEPIPARAGGQLVTPRWPEDHANIDPHRHLGSG